MNKKILIGSIIAVVLLTLVSFSSVVGVQSVKSNPDATQIDFELQRIRDLVHSIDLREIIVNPDAVVDTLEEISSILEEEDVRNYIEKTSEEDCGCEEKSSTFEWNFPGICTLLFPIFTISVILLMLFSMYNLFWFVEDLAKELNCFFVRPWYPFVYIS